MLEKWLDVSTTPLTGNHICVNISDVSELKNGEIRLKEQNYRLSCLSAELLHIVDSIQKMISQPYLAHGTEIKATVSIGVATYL